MPRETFDNNLTRDDPLRARLAALVENWRSRVEQYRHLREGDRDYAAGMAMCATELDAALRAGPAAAPPETSLPRNWCSQCGEHLLEADWSPSAACGPTHAMLANDLGQLIMRAFAAARAAPPSTETS